MSALDQNTATDPRPRPCAQPIQWRSGCGVCSTEVFGRAGAQPAVGAVRGARGPSRCANCPYAQLRPRDCPSKRCSPSRAPVHRACACNTPQRPGCPLLPVVDAAAPDLCLLFVRAAAGAPTCAPAPQPPAAACSAARLVLHLPHQCSFPAHQGSTWGL